jgi:hypothetical protein
MPNGMRVALLPTLSLAIPSSLPTMMTPVASDDGRM